MSEEVNQVGPSIVNDTAGELLPPIRKEAEMQVLMKVLQSLLPPDTGIMLFVAPFAKSDDEPDVNMQFISNARKEDVKAMLTKFVTDL